MNLIFVIAFGRVLGSSTSIPVATVNISYAIAGAMPTNTQVRQDSPLPLHVNGVDY